MPVPASRLLVVIDEPPAREHDAESACLSAARHSSVLGLQRVALSVAVHALACGTLDFVISTSQQLACHRFDSLAVNNVLHDAAHGLLGSYWLAPRFSVSAKLRPDGLLAQSVVELGCKDRRHVGVRP